MAGAMNGLDRTAEQREQIEALLERLEQESPTPSPAAADLAGTSWQLVYTNSAGNSAGKLGPLVGSTGQCFPTPGRYINQSAFGGGLLLRTRLHGTYAAAGDRRINLEFSHVVFQALGGLLTFKKDFPPGFKGHWTMRWADPELRVLTTNQGNTFVLRLLPGVIAE